MQLVWMRVAGCMVLAAMLSMLLGSGSAVAQDSDESEGLTPFFGDGRLTITGGGFGAGEQITLTVQFTGTRHQFMVTADAQGEFRLATELMLSPGASVQIEARGDQGTTQAVITRELLGAYGLPLGLGLQERQAHLPAGQRLAHAKADH